MEATSEAAIGSGTPLWAASVSAIESLSEAAGKNRIAVIFTDGGDTSYDDPSEVITAARAVGVRVFYIGLGEALNESAMLDIAKATEPNGLYVSAADTSKLLQAFDGVINSSQASGCIDLTFSPVPPAGQTVSGELSFDINGGRFNGDYQVTF